MTNEVQGTAGGTTAAAEPPPKVDNVQFDARKFWIAQFVCEHPGAPDSPLSQACVFAADFDDARSAVEDGVVGRVLHQRDVTGIKMFSLGEQRLPPVLPS